MMSKKNETSSIKALVTAAAISAASLTTTVNTVGIITPLPALQSVPLNHGIGTGEYTQTLMPVVVEEKKETSYEQATKLFGCKMRDFTEMEAKTYHKALEKIYKPIGVNVFDLC